MAVPPLAGFSVVLIRNGTSLLKTVVTWAGVLQQRAAMPVFKPQILWSIAAGLTNGTPFECAVF
jgi:hypothetical protein